MIVDQLATPRSNSTIRPNCPECQTPMRLFGIESEDRPRIALLRVPQLPVH